MGRLTRSNDNRRDVPGHAARSRPRSSRHAREGGHRDHAESGPADVASVVDLDDLGRSACSGAGGIWDRGPLPRDWRRSGRIVPRIAVNSCDWPELCLLPGINETRARRIVADRQTHGPFRGARRFAACLGDWSQDASPSVALARLLVSLPTAQGGRHERGRVR